MSDTDATDDTGSIDVREHYDRISPVVEALAETDGAVTLANNDRRGWYIKRNCRNSEALEEGFDREGRPATLLADWDTIKTRIDRVLYAITSYKDPHALMDWEPCTWDAADESTHWRTGSPMPEYADIRAGALWGDIDLVDELKPKRGDLNADTQALVEETLAAYAEEFATLYGSEDAVFALDSVGGAYVMGSPSATIPIADHFSNDVDARERVMEAVMYKQSKEWLEAAQERVEDRVDGAADVIDPDWCNNRNRAYKAPLSLHADHDGVVTPMDPFDPTYEMTPVGAVDEGIVDDAVAWADELTSLECQEISANLVAALWPEYIDDHADWRIALEEWVEDERREESRPKHDHDPTEASTSTDHRITPFLDDVKSAIDGLDAFAVGEKTIVSSWTKDVSGARDNSGSNKKAFLPTWGPSLGGGTGNANYIHEKGVWVDTSANDHGTVVEMALIGQENWTRGKIADGEDWARGVAHLRDLGFDIPVWTPDATVAEDGQMPYWSLKQAAFALGVCTEDDLDYDEDAGYKRFDAETYNAALEAVEEAGLDHGRAKVQKGGGSGSGSGSSKGSALFDLSPREALEATHPDVEPPSKLQLTPPDHPGGTVRVDETDAGGIRLYDPSVDGGYEYIALSWLAVNSGTRSALSPSGQFDDRELWAAWKLAKHEHLLPFDDPIPLRARLHIAREHDLAPEELIEAAYDDPKSLPAAVYNRILAVVEDEYGLNPGLDDLETDEKDEQRAEFLARGDDDDLDKADEVKRMLATLDEVG